MINDLFDEELLKPKKKKTIKPSTLIAIAVILLTILCVLAIVAIIYIKGTILTITMDGKDAKSLEEIFIMEENNKVYIPIKRMARFLGYSAYNGDYITLSEDDTTKCYIKSENQIISFIADSNVITKVIAGQTQQIKIAEPIKEINGELCINSDGAQKAFDFRFYYDIAKKDITIHTLNYLYNWYSMQLTQEGYLPIEQETYENKSAVLDDMIIVKSSNNYYGVISIQGSTILESKYDSIQYFSKTSEFLVESNGKKGIISKDRKTKVEMHYDSIEIVTNKNDIFYIIGISNLYGVIDKNGEIIIYPEYEQIGIDVTPYSQNGVTNGYILYNKYVPVKNNNKWGLYNTNGEKVTDLIYDSFGSPSKATRTYGVIEVPDYNLLVACQGEKYNLINLKGQGIFNRFILDSVYIKISEGKKIYYITSGTTTKELISYLQENGIEKPTPIE